MTRPRKGTILPKRLAFAVAAAALPYAHQAQAELVGHWPMNEGEGELVADASGNGRDGVFGGVGGGPWSDDTPPTGFANPWSLSFDGVDDYVETAYQGIGGDAPRTVSFWIKTTATNTHGIVAWGLSTSDGAKYHIRVNDAAGNGPVGAIRTEVQGDFHIGTVIVNDGQWHHIVSVFPEDPLTGTVEDVLHYVDGELDFTGGAGGGSPLVFTDDFADPVTIGRRTQGTGQNYFPGLIDDVRIYDRELSEAEIQALPTSPTTDGLVGHWDFDEGPENTVFEDKGSGGNDGTLIGAMVTEPTVEWSDDAPPGLDASLFFPGDGWVDTAYAGIGGTAARTIMAWARLDPINATQDNGFLGYGLTANSSKWHMRVNTGAADGVVGAFRVEIQGTRTVGTQVVTDGEWHHLAATFEDDGTPDIEDVVLYVDGQVDPISMVATPFLLDTIIDDPSSKPVSFGRRLQGETPRYLVGNLADVRIYDEALTQAEIEAIMNNPGSGGGPAPFQVTAIEVGDAGAVTLTWNSRGGRSYRIEEWLTFGDTSGWFELVDGVPADGPETTFTVPAPAEVPPARYLRVAEE